MGDLPAQAGGAGSCVLAVATAACLSAVYLVWDARRLNETGRFRRRWHGSGDHGRAAVPHERQFILPRWCL